MGIMSRMLRLCKADAHGVMDQLEDKGLLLKQYLREMEGNLKTKENRRLLIAKQLRQIERDLAMRKDEAAKLEKDLDLAVFKEKDDIARMLIRKRRALEGRCKQLAGQIENLKEEQSHLNETLSRQRLQYEDLKVKASSFFQQAEQQGFEEAQSTADAAYGWPATSDEEVELELLQRKEAHVQGGAP